MPRAALIRCDVTAHGACRQGMHLEHVDALHTSSISRLIGLRAFSTSVPLHCTRPIPVAGIPGRPAYCVLAPRGVGSPGGSPGGH